MKRCITIFYERQSRPGPTLGWRHFWVKRADSAIADLHQILQRSEGWPHDSYRLTRITHSYKGPAGEDIASDFDLPGGPNPDLWPEQPPPAGTATFAFMDDPAFAPKSTSDTNASTTSTYSD